MRVAKIAIGIMFFANLAFIGYFSDRLIDSRPSVPSGYFTIPFEAHGGTTYVTQLDFTLYDGSWVVGFLLLFLAGVLTFLEKRRGSRRTQSPGE
jgi:uncharacterized membrane protein affecting hemolysin expression